VASVTTATAVKNLFVFIRDSPWESGATQALLEHNPGSGRMFLNPYSGTVFESAEIGLATLHDHIAWALG
jgi:hypothetical protein